MSIKPTGVIDYGQYDADQGATTTERRIPAGGPVYASGGFTGYQKPADSISISLEFLRGVEAAAAFAHAEYSDTEKDEITSSVIAAEVDRLRKEAAK